MQLSSLVDRGRWFFPNLHRTEFGLEKEFRQLTRFHDTPQAAQGEPLERCTGAFVNEFFL